MQMISCFVHLVAYNIMVKTGIKMDIMRVRLIILKFLYCVVVIWQLMWNTCMSREFI
jgi:hypothetical protein